MKQYRIQCNVGRCRYAVSYHDGVKTHADGSPFFDISIFANKRQADRFVRGLVAKGFVPL